MLGVVMLLWWTGPAIGAALESAGVILRARVAPNAPERFPPAWLHVAAALAVVLARRPISWLLAYGPLLPGRAGVRRESTSDSED